MRKINFMFLFCSLMMMSIGASAYDFSAENADGVTIYYDVTSPTTCEVTYKSTPSIQYSGIVDIPTSVAYKSKTYSVTSIGSMAFFRSTGLTDVVIPNSVTNIGGSVFEYCERLTSVTIPNSVTSIGNYAFSYCSGLTSVTIGNSVTSIGEYAFWNCSGLTSVTIGNSVTSIGNNAFYNCSAITSIEIPNSVTSIGSSAFSGCSALEDVFVNWSEPLTIGNNVFDKTPKGFILITLHVPTGKTKIYQSTKEWCDFIDIKEWDPSTEIEVINATDEASPMSSPEGKDLYNLQGQKVSINGFRGVIIKNGKRYLTK